MAAVAAPAPHDLLRVDPAITARWANAPAWAARALTAAPWVVVRRAAAGLRPGDVAVGVRGNDRTERFAATVRRADICTMRTPYALLDALRDGPSPLHAAALSVRALAGKYGVRCGVAGSFGFACASGVRATHAGSDLDLVVDGRAPRAALAAFAHACDAAARATGVRVDVEVQLAAGGVALAEFVARREPVLVKTPSGPQLLHVS